jgi:SAM-dependent methyltransferase
MENKKMAHTTRGRGIAEPLLAYLRARKANSLIPARLRSGNILDIGCGTYPYFLAHTSFEKKYAIDQVALPAQTSEVLRIQSFTLDLDNEPKLPFDNGFFSTVTLLAVVEHLDPANMALLFREVYRVLKPGGQVILTTPAAWSSGILRFLSRIGVVSKEEIDEHTYAYTLPILGWYFGQAGFEMTKIRFGYFEGILNLWATAEK